MVDTIIHAGCRTKIRANSANLLILVLNDTRQSDRMGGPDGQDRIAIGVN